MNEQNMSGGVDFYDHPLLQSDKDAAQKKWAKAPIGKMRLYRILPGNRRVTFPRDIEPWELQTVEELHALVGGGSYQLIAWTRTQAEGHEPGRKVKGSGHFTFSGPTIPFPGEDGAPGVPAEPNAAGFNPMAMAGGNGMIGLFMMMMQQQNQQMQLMMKQQQDASNHSTQLQVAQIEASSKSTAAMVSALSAGLPALIGAIGKGSSSGDLLSQFSALNSIVDTARRDGRDNAIEILEKVGGDDDDDDIGNIMETVTQGIQAAGMAKEVFKKEKPAQPKVIQAAPQQQAAPTQAPAGGNDAND